MTDLSTCSGPPSISVVTAALPAHAGKLVDAYASLQVQPVSWEWLLQIDGPEPVDLPFVDVDSRVRVERNQRNRGPAVSRTLAAARSRAPAVRVLDSDDMLTPGALERDIGALFSHPGALWAVSRADDFDPATGEVTSVTGPAGGRIPRGSLVDAWLQDPTCPLVHPATLCVRTDALFAVGGWMALPASEDTGLLLALNAASDGVLTDEVGMLYRKWGGQLTKAPEHEEGTERRLRHQAIRRRVTSLQRLWFP